MRNLIYLLVIVILVGGCGTPSVYREVFKNSPSQYNSRTFSCSQNLVYAALLKALYSRQFIVENENKETGDLLAKRSFQKGKRSITLLLQTKMVTNEDGTTLFLSAIETTERLYVSDRTRFFLLVIPLPGGGGKEATKIKEQERPIEDRKFYQQFFDAIEKEIQPGTEKIITPVINPNLEILED